MSGPILSRFIPIGVLVGLAAGGPLPLGGLPETARSLAAQPDDEAAAGLPRVAVAESNQGFVLLPSGQPFVPWGHNYASVDILERHASDPQRVQREFQDMRDSGTTVARIHPELPRFYRDSGDDNPAAWQQMRELLQLAEQSGIYLKITGLGCYQVSQRMDWYDRLDEPQRWAVQAQFWSRMAETCADSPAVFAYDLINEPVAVGKPEDGWYMGEIGGHEFCQRLSLTANDRDGNEIFQQWTARMVAAIRQHDSHHLITMGMFPFPNVYQGSADQLDFVSPHLYPKTGKVDEELELLRRFDWGKPIVIGETFPLGCSAEDLRDFLVRSRGTAHGWIGHWPDQPPAELAAKRDAQQATIADAIWLSWVELFRELTPRFQPGGDG